MLRTLAWSLLGVFLLGLRPAYADPIIIFFPDKIAAHPPKKYQAAKPKQYFLSLSSLFSSDPWSCRP